MDQSSCSTSHRLDLRHPEVLLPPTRPRYSVSGPSSYLSPALALGFWALLIAFSILLIEPFFLSSLKQLTLPGLLSILHSNQTFLYPSQSAYQILIRDLQGHPQTLEDIRQSTDPPPDK
ncbi:hypothetical protein ASPFODRAFT_34971 [Aspergillus luchuensis CBS 106.47]|uniref:Uncharacterized protein n=1 Tax=Aspergillus luchuensis (strain CBS 106.47) TaxID=1137211 RepID=A0A1M3TDD5_ASPLC|nr:hypothetical protein ASPFODRAFT_34971 [Aspergillus luchuensis CBS 106.47]